MRRILPILGAILFAAAVVGSQAAERFPPPEFDTHQLPRTMTPGPRADALEYVDVAALAVALSLASYLALRRRSRAGLVALMIASIAYFGFWRKGCICPVGATQNVVLAFFDHSYGLPLSVAAFFFLPLVFTLFFGRTFCAAVCPLGAAQDLVVLRPMQVPRWLDQALRMFAWIYLAAAILFAAAGSAFVVCQYDPFVAFFRVSGRLSMLVFGACVLAIGMFVGRPYCRYLCPYGVLLGLCSSFSRWRVTITPDVCIQCRLCEESCPFGAIRPAMTEWSGVDRAAGKRLLAALLVALPLAGAGVGWLGWRLGPTLARENRTVQLAEQVWQENAGEAGGISVASKAYRDAGGQERSLYAEALAVEARFTRISAALGALLGLAFIGELIRFTVRRKQPDYEAERIACLACGRCYRYCPRERVRRKPVGIED